MPKITNNVTEATHEPILQTFQVNIKYINSRGQIRSAALAVGAPTQEDARSTGLGSAKALYGETARVTTITLW